MDRHYAKIDPAIAASLKKKSKKKSNNDLIRNSVESPPTMAPFMAATTSQLTLQAPEVTPSAVNTAPAHTGWNNSAFPGLTNPFFPLAAAQIPVSMQQQQNQQQQQFQSVNQNPVTLTSQVLKDGSIGAMGSMDRSAILASLRKIGETSLLQAMPK